MRIQGPGLLALSIWLACSAPVSAAAPMAPDLLPSQIVGVIGSGDKLSLRIKEAGKTRDLSIGSVYSDGWTLRALTDSVAILVKGDQARTVGLNPGGDLARSPDDPRSVVMVLGALTPEQQAAVDGEIAAGRWNGQPTWGLSASQTAYLVAYDVQRGLANAAWYSKNWVAGRLGTDIPTRPTDLDIYGAEYENYRALAQLRSEYRLVNSLAELAARPLTGPSSIYLLPEEVPIRAITAAGADPRGTWALSVADDTGGRTLSRTSTASSDPGVLGSAMANSGRNF